MHYVRVSGNVRCAVEDINPNGRNAVLFVHGWPLSHRIFEYQYNVLPNYGIRCIGYDIRGYGESDRPFSGYSYNRLADDLHAIIETINCRTVTLLGFSMGAAICIRYMARHRCFKVNKLVLCGAAAPVFIKTQENPYGMSRDKVNNLIQQTYNDRQAMSDSFGRMCFASEASGPFMQWFSGISWEAAGYATIRGLEALRDENLHNDLLKFNTRTMILHGTKDKVCPFPLAEEIHKFLKNSFIIPFENSGHCLFYDEKDKFNDKLIDFIKM